MCQSISTSSTIELYHSCPCDANDVTASALAVYVNTRQLLAWNCFGLVALVVPSTNAKFAVVDASVLTNGLNPIAFNKPVVSTNLISPPCA